LGNGVYWKIVDATYDLYIFLEEEETIEVALIITFNTMA
jgi:hypothetical protein